MSAKKITKKSAIKKDAKISKNGAAVKANVKTAKAKKPAAAKPKRTSALDAAAVVLKKANKPMRSQDLIEAMAAQGLWQSPGGKTPHATLYAAILREITAKGKAARFKKTDRGQFASNGKGA